MLRLDASALDYTILAIYFAVVLGIGAVAATRRSRPTSTSSCPAARCPPWITGLAFVAANLGALEILGMAANGAQYGVTTVHFYWIGAVPAMVFLGIVMMPFYYRRRSAASPSTCACASTTPRTLLNAITFAMATVLIAGVNLFALALVINLMLGWSMPVSIVVAAVIVLVYITLGGLTSAIYNEVLQFFIILAGAAPADASSRCTTWAAGAGCRTRSRQTPLGEAGLHAWQGRHRQGHEPDGRQLDRDRVRPRLRPVLRVLDDELRRGPARAVGQEHCRPRGARRSSAPTRRSSSRR